MIENNNDLAELISNSQVAFLNGRYQEAFSLARSAIKLDPKCADAYQCAANVCMSLSRYEDAIEYYQQAVNCDLDNGNRYFNLGYFSRLNMNNGLSLSYTSNSIINHMI